MSQSRSTVVTAMILMIIGMCSLPFGDVFAKLATEQSSYNGPALAFLRFSAGIIIIFPICMMMSGFSNLKASFWKAQFLRGCLVALIVSCIITAVSLIPLAETFAAFFVGPIIATILSALLLSEKVRRIEWFAVMFGFVGVLIVVQPVNSLEPGILWAIAAGVFYGCFLTATRWARDTGPPLSQNLAQFIFASLLLSPFVLPEISISDLSVPSLLLGSGVFSTLGNLLSIIALGMARAAKLAPLVYFQLPAATLYGWLFFDSLPQTTTIAGMLVIIVAGFLPVLQSEKKQA